MTKFMANYGIIKDLALSLIVISVIFLMYLLLTIRKIGPDLKDKFQLVFIGMDQGTAVSLIGPDFIKLQHNNITIFQWFEKDKTPTDELLFTKRVRIYTENYKVVKKEYLNLLNNNEFLEI